jgi:SAM-dependent methyltransferase
VPAPPELDAAPDAGHRPGYGPDLAYAHRTGHSDFVRLAVPTVLARLRAAGLRDGLVVDLGCGTGILARALVRAGYDVLGVDLSPEMIRLARRTAPQASFVCGSYLDVDLPRCAAVTSIGQSLGYTFDPRVGTATLATTIARIATALVPGGLLLCDLNTPVPTDQAPQLHFRHEPQWTLCVRTVIGERVLTRDITVFRRHGAGYRRSDERHEVLLVGPAWMLDVLARNGFTGQTFHDYDGAPFPALLTGYQAVKRA